MLTGIKLRQINRKSVNHKVYLYSINTISTLEENSTIYSSLQVNLRKALIKLSAKHPVTFTPHKMIYLKKNMQFPQTVIKHQILSFATCYSEYNSSILKIRSI